MNKCIPTALILSTCVLKGQDYIVTTNADKTVTIDQYIGQGGNIEIPKYIDGHRVGCISPEQMVKDHIGYKPREKDYNDVFALCEAYSIVVPEEYRR